MRQPKKRYDNIAADNAAKSSRELSKTLKDIDVFSGR